MSYPKRLVIGRPVTFAGAVPDEALAHARYMAAFQGAGLRGGALRARARGGGLLLRPAAHAPPPFWWAISAAAPPTSRSCASCRAMPHRRWRMPAWGLPGDSFDFRIIDNRCGVAAIGQARDHSKAGARSCRSRSHYFTSFSRWNELSMMNRPPVIKALREFADAARTTGSSEAFIASASSKRGAGIASIRQRSPG